MSPRLFHRVCVVPLGLALFLAACAPSSVSFPASRSSEYLFCFWNVENLFDDEDNPKDMAADKAYDDWFAHDEAARRLKYEHVSQAVAEMNGGKGPDILALAEVESERAVELLRDALNARLSDPALHYSK